MMLSPARRHKKQTLWLFFEVFTHSKRFWFKTNTDKQTMSLSYITKIPTVPFLIMCTLRSSSLGATKPMMSLLHLLLCMTDTSALFLQSKASSFQHDFIGHIYIHCPYYSAESIFDLMTQWKTCIVFSLVTDFEVMPWVWAQQIEKLEKLRGIRSSLHFNCLIFLQQGWNKWNKSHYSVITGSNTWHLILLSIKVTLVEPGLIFFGLIYCQWNVRH